jgi:5-methylcytosine-specific restriction endonuclease McrA
MKPQPKPTTRKAEKRAKDEQEWARRSKVRKVVILRDGSRCRHCLRLTGPTGEVHELRFRSLGGSALRPSNCVTLCSRCHPKVTSNRLTIEAIDHRRGANGPLRFSDTDVYSYPQEGTF